MHIISEDSLVQLQYSISSNVLYCTGTNILDDKIGSCLQHFCETDLLCVPVLVPASWHLLYQHDTSILEWNAGTVQYGTDNTGSASLWSYFTVRRTVWMFRSANSVFICRLHQTGTFWCRVLQYSICIIDFREPFSSTRETRKRSEAKWSEGHSWQRPVYCHWWLVLKNAK